MLPRSASGEPPGYYLSALSKVDNCVVRNFRAAFVAWTILVISTLAGDASLARAQAPVRRIQGEVSGNLFFGNTRQVLTSVRSDWEHSDSVYSFRLQARFNYGETKTDQAGTLVTKRSYTSGVDYGLNPFGDFKPYLRGNAEASLEKRIARRYSGGTGARLNITRTPSTDAIFSAGIVVEYTAALPGVNVAGPVTLARGTSSFRFRHNLSDRVTLTNDTSYEPALERRRSDYTVISQTSTRVKLATSAALTVSFRDSYDSRARGRGARTNNDGELLFGLLTTF